MVLVSDDALGGTLEMMLPNHACECRHGAHSAHPWASRAADGASRCASTARAQPARAWVFGSRASLVPRRGLYSIYDMKTIYDQHTHVQANLYAHRQIRFLNARPRLYHGSSKKARSSWMA